MAKQNNSEQLKKLKKRFLEELITHKGDKNDAAKSVGVNLVEIRSWRQKDKDFNEKYKTQVIGSDQSKQRTNLKEPFIELLNNGFSQRESCEKLHLSIVTLRTWKKVDPDFKDACLTARFNKG
jgi:hypothetical protein